LIAPVRDTVTTLAGTSHKVTVTKSVGVAMFPDDVTRPPRREESVDLNTLKLMGSELSDKANEALLAAKAKGKGQVIFYGDL
jgi:GGDEF domain-containing protein